jgi:hypothetical protein
MVPGHTPVSVSTLTRGSVRDEDLPEVLYEVRNRAEDLRLLLTGDGGG